MSTNDLRLVILPGKLPSNELKNDYNKAYECWHSVWKDTYENDFGDHKKLSSNDFTRQDEIVALFYKDECVGLTFMKWVNFDNATARHDSYFTPWTDIDIQKLCSDGKRIIICSNFTISLDFRRGKGGYNWKDLLVCFSILRLLHSDADGMTGTMRVSKGMAEATYRAGGVPIRREVHFSQTDDTVDLVGFYRRKIKQCGTDEVLPIAYEVWNRRNLGVMPLIKDIVAIAA